MSILIQKSRDRAVFERLYQLYCYESGEGVIGQDALYKVPDEIITYTVEKCGIPCGFAIFSDVRCLERLFVLKECREAKLMGTVLTQLFDEDVGKWCVPCEFENYVREYTSGDFKREKQLFFDNSGRYKEDGSFVDYDDISSVINSYEINAVKHGKCLSERRFADAAKYSARLFAMREKIKEKELVYDVVSPLIAKGGNITVWTAGLALSAGIMKDEAADALIKLQNDADFSASAALLLEEYKNR